MKRTLVTLSAVGVLTATLAAVSAPSSANPSGETVAGSRSISPTLFDLGPDNTWTPDLRGEMERSGNPPVYVSNLAGMDVVPPHLGYVGSLTETANKKGYNTVTCSYATAYWINGYTSGNARWNGGPMLDAYVKGSDAALGVGFSSKTSSASSEVGVWLTMPRNWPTPSSVTVDYRWGGGAYLQADADLSVLAGTGASSATASYAIDGELWADSLSARSHFYSKTVTANGTRPSSSANVHVRWDDKSDAVVPTLKVPTQPSMSLISKLVGSMTDTANPVPGASASAGVDSWSSGDTYIVGSQHFTFTIPKGYTVTSCGGDGVMS